MEAVSLGGSKRWFQGEETWITTHKVYGHDLLRALCLLRRTLCEDCIPVHRPVFGAQLSTQNIFRCSSIICLMNEVSDIHL